MTIGAVLAALQPDFPEVSISKLRFLEAEGLVTPARTGSGGYRSYSPEDLDRLRYVLTAQRDHFWPLKVIREALDALDRGLTPDDSTTGLSRPKAPQPVADPDVPTARALTAGKPLRLNRAELAESAGLDTDALQALESFGLLRPDATGHFGEPALTVAHTAAALAAYGIEPRHPRAFRTAADREIGLVQQAATPRRTDPAEVLRLCIALHTALVREGLTRD
jgi:DNA-binding transcriptional MerR regulator